MNWVIGKSGFEPQAGSNPAQPGDWLTTQIASCPSSIQGRAAVLRLGGRASDLARPGGAIGQTRQAEIDDPRLAATIDHDVGWLKVAVQHSFFMRRRQTGAELLAKRPTQD
jgi:hypothetical protein